MAHRENELAVYACDNEKNDKQSRINDSATSSTSSHGEIDSGNSRIPDINSSTYMTGWRLQVATIALCLSLLLSSVETTIISTSLVNISNAFNAFDRSSWIVTAYLLTYTGFLLIIAKLSDIFGRKSMILFTLATFTVFSIACGLAQSVIQLIVFRALQGIGGGGIFTMVFAILPEMVPPSGYALYSTILSSVFALSNLLGPVLGGVINNHTTWRWIFYLNAPAGAVTFALLVLAIPANFPQPQAETKAPRSVALVIHSLKKIDFLGTLLLLAASVLLVTALQETGTEYPWRSVFVIALLTISGILWIGFLLWERFLSQRGSRQEPMLPWRLVKNRIFMGVVLSTFFFGLPFLAVVINLPQKFQFVDGTSPLGAGLRLLALVLSTPVASGIAGFLMQKLKIPPLYNLLCGGILLTIGLALMSTITPTNQSVSAAEYGYEVVVGLGLGFGLSTVIMAVPMLVERSDVAVAMGTIAQARMLGGTIGLAICTTILNSRIESDLSSILSPAQLAGLLQSSRVLQELEPQQRDIAKRVYEDSFDQQMRVLVAFGAATLLSSLIMLEKKPRRME
ncbi:MAG: hypothetical protein MMC33_008941 [Icmadophila ericetorum]|nr:hypothetical protein [Icmadophila ericetorum]